jgi:hypothetical protein
MEAEEFVRLAAETLRKARELPVGPERNELRQVALGLKWMAKRNLSELGAR